MLPPDEFYKVVGKAMFSTPRQKRAVMVRCNKNADTPKGIMHDVWVKTANLDLRGHKPSTFIYYQLKWTIAGRPSYDALQQTTHVTIEDRHSHEGDQQESIEQAERRDKLNDALRFLRDREALAVRLRWGLIDGVTYTLEELARCFGVTRERARQIEMKAMRQLEYWLIVRRYRSKSR